MGTVSKSLPHRLHGWIIRRSLAFPCPISCQALAIAASSTTLLDERPDPFSDVRFTWSVGHVIRRAHHRAFVILHLVTLYLFSPTILSPARFTGDRLLRNKPSGADANRGGAFFGQNGEVVGYS